jgi:NADH dehydrogenase
MTGISKVMIIGGGFAGLEAAKGLTGAAVEITLLDKQNHHCFQPLLYQVATAALSPAEIAWPIREILRDQRNTQVLLAEVEAIDRVARTVHVGETRYAYDYLVVATGATHSYFGHDEWARIAPGLKRIEDATRIRRNILLAFERPRRRKIRPRDSAISPSRSSAGARPESKWPAQFPNSGPIHARSLRRCRSVRS